MANPSAFPFLELPAELQCYILELAADSAPSKAINLALISHSAATYVLPRIYRKVSLGTRGNGEDDAKFKTALSSIPREFFAAHVKHLCITSRVSSPDVVSALTTCIGVVDLVLWAEFSDEIKGEELEGIYAKLLQPLPLRRISCRYDHLRDVELHPCSRSPPCWYQTLTHLDLFYGGVQGVGTSFTVPLLGYLQELTHLSICPDSSYDNLFNEHGLALILQARPSLKVVLVQLTQFFSASYPVPVDIRIVYRPGLFGDEAIANWEAGWDGTDDMWTLAEEVVSQRRRALKRNAL